MPREHQPAHLQRTSSRHVGRADRQVANEGGGDREIAAIFLSLILAREC
jgi:hypothetical protein